MAAIRGLATDADPRIREAAYDAEMRAWPTVAVTCAAAMNAVKGEANIVNRRRGWDSPIEASLFANNVSRATFDAMQSAVDASLPDFRRWMHAKARLHGHSGALPWYDLFAPLPFAPSSTSPGPRAWRSSAARSRRTASRSAAWSTAPSTSSGSTPALAKESAAARSACRSSTTDRWCFSTGAAASTRRRPRRTNSVTPTTTPNSPTARRCSDACRWRWPRRRASSARHWWSRKVCSTSPGSIGWLCSTSTCSAPCRRSSTSAAGSSSRPRSSPAANAARSGYRSSTR